MKQMIGHIPQDCSAHTRCLYLNLLYRTMNPSEQNNPKWSLHQFLEMRKRLHPVMEDLTAKALVHHHLSGTPETEGGPNPHLESLLAGLKPHMRWRQFQKDSTIPALRHGRGRHTPLRFLARYQLARRVVRGHQSREWLMIIV
jgi:hypothetical protein